MPDTFTSQRYPTVEETLCNNATHLYKQKKQFLRDLRTLLGTLGYALIGVVYLRDVSVFLLALRLMVHSFLSNPFASNVTTLMLNEDNKNEQRVFLLGCVVIVNSISFLDHLLLGTYSTSHAIDHQLHGGLSTQFIGERLPISRLEPIVYDVFIFSLQIVFYCLMCATDDSEVTQSPVTEQLTPESPVSSNAVSDGFNGNVSLLTVDVWSSISRVWNYERTTPREEGSNSETLRERAFQQLFV